MGLGFLRELFYIWLLPYTYYCSKFAPVTAVVTAVFMENRV